MEYTWNSAVDEEDFQHIRISGKAGRWNATEKCETEEATYYLYENDKDELFIPSVVVKYVDEQPIEIFETEFDLLTFLESECII